MANHERILKPGQAQLRRAAFCLKLLGLLVVFTFLTAIVVGLPFPGIWNAVFVPTIPAIGFFLIFFEFVFLLRALWLKVKVRHFAAVVKMNIGD